MRLLIAALALASMGCGQSNAPSGTAASTTPRVTATGVIDNADLLDPAGEGRVAAKVRSVSAQLQRPLLVVLVRPAEGQSLEQLGWATRGAGSPGGPMLLIADPDSAAVRVESGGDFPPEKSAAVARAISPDLRDGRVEQALLAGLDELALQGSRTT